MRLGEFVKLLAPTPRSVKLHPRRHWTASIGRAEATGTDADTALAFLREKIITAFDSGYTPLTLFYRGHLGLLTRRPEDWAYCIIPPDRLQAQGGRLIWQWAASLHDTELGARLALLAHMAQYTWDGQEETSPLLEGDAEAQERFTRDARRQKRYTALKQTTDMSDEQIREQIMQEHL